MVEVDLYIADTGSIYYYIKGTLMFHRDDGPALSYPNGTKGWYQYGKLHREDGPALISYNDEHVWYLNNKIVFVSSQEEFEQSLEYRTWKLKAFT